MPNLPSPPDLSKAYELLGLDPSMHKASQLFGTDVITLEQAQTEINMLPRKSQKQLNDVLPERDSKAYELLGLDPSMHKASQLFGTDVITLEQAQTEINMLPRLPTKRASDILPLDQNSKAYALLALNPSVHVTSRFFGVDPPTIESAMSSNSAI